MHDDERDGVGLEITKDLIPSFTGGGEARDNEWS